MGTAVGYPSLLGTKQTTGLPPPAAYAIVGEVKLGHFGQSAEVSLLAVDARRRRLFAASSNLILRRGVYVRSLPLTSSE